MTLSQDKDPMGRAILDYQMTGKAGRLRVLSTMFDEDEMPVAHLFRTEAEMPALERRALALARGRVLDVGAGAGCHSIVLSEHGMEVTSIDISPLSCEAMRLRGLRDVRCTDLFDPTFVGQYDTILMLMNGTGIAGRAERLADLMQRLKMLLVPGGQVLIDSSDLRYIYENEDGTLDIDPEAGYYGEVDYQMVYRSQRGEPFDWLYADYDLLAAAARAAGFAATLVMEGDHYDYLACLTL